MTTRGSLIDYLEPILAATEGLEAVKFIRTIRPVDQPSQPVLILKTDSIEPLPEAPRSAPLGRFTLILVSPHVDPDKAEPQLDDLLEILLPALFGAGVMWERATQTAYDESHLSYDIAIRSILS